MALYGSCLDNRIQVARPYLDYAKKAGAPTRGYPYYIIDLAVRMRPIVEEIEGTGRAQLSIPLLNFEPPAAKTKNKYSHEHEVEIRTILNAIIHEIYILAGPAQLDVASDKGRWIVSFPEFLKALDSYMLSRDKIAAVICEMIHLWLISAEKNPQKHTGRLAVFSMSNLSWNFDWLCTEYVDMEVALKTKFMDEFFQGRDIMFAPNTCDITGFDIAGGRKIPHRMAIPWKAFLEIVREYIKSKNVS